jgi:hypothetical protein
MVTGINLKPNLPQGILKCRDLVQLYYGLPMVVNTKSTVFPASAAPYLILGQDPRRIRYEIWLNPSSVEVEANILLGTPAEIDAGMGVSLTPGNTDGPVVERDFLTDLDGVTIAQMILDSSGEVVFSVRETFLTPAPVDEIPEG